MPVAVRPPRARSWTGGRAGRLRVVPPTAGGAPSRLRRPSRARSTSFMLPMRRSRSFTSMRPTSPSSSGENWRPETFDREGNGVLDTWEARMAATVLPSLGNGSSPASISNRISPNA